MISPKLKLGDTIGIICPCHVASKEKYTQFLKGINKHGFKVKEGKNLYKTTYGYAASEQERADDFNDMILDPEVKMILFGGGNVGNELLPYIDFDAIKEHPKIICSYSNGTTILNSIYAQTGLTVYYGQFPGVFANISYYDSMQFHSHFTKDESPMMFEKNSEWTCINNGVCEGILIGGYTTRFAFLMGSKYFPYDKNKEYILFLENYEAFNEPSKISAHLAHIEQHEFIKHVKGLLFGHYSMNSYPEFNEILMRFGQRNHIPIVKCDDFGHGVNHGILPIGAHAQLDANSKTLQFLDLQL
ncbi:LD-carboxypeptidase [Mobilitalea sibirica]|uniref:LD-carboxypeptidase n=1 Tax=Mobilitalea sibirica TaxID=1462919 RepID=A0A8J7KVD0_9FIRM|nr:LD-carboxypeptidase [Mobilitalea sibirica]MBH1940015.1 LD-carboxypeptidase [Mobilitalea sibirica]